MSVTFKLAQELISTRFEDIPIGAIARLKRLFVDHIGITYMGYREVGQELCAYARDVGGPPETVLIGDGARVSCEVAGAINAQNARNTDFEDSGPGLHPGPMVVHTAFAVAQRCGSSGRELLSAMALGHEFNSRFFLNSISGPDVRHNNMAAAAIAARLLGLDLETSRRALSLAWEFPIKAINYTRPKIERRITSLGMGNIFSVRSGIQSALMAAHGFESVPDEVDQQGDLYNLSKLADRSKAFEQTQYNLYLKPWPTSHGCHMVVQLIEEIVRHNDLRPEDIEEIRAGLPDVYLMPHQNNPSPVRYWEALYSTAWAFSMVVHGVPPGPDWFTKRRISDQAYHITARKVVIVEHKAGTKMFQALDLPRVEGWAEIKSSKGIFSGSKTMAETYGSPTRPMTDEMFNGKFLRVSSPSLGDKKAEELLGALQGIEDCPNVQDLAAML